MKMPGSHNLCLSYAGTLYSLDDLYSLSSGLLVLETTLFIYNTSLLEGLAGGEGVVWLPVRVMLANRYSPHPSFSFSCFSY